MTWDLCIFGLFRDGRIRVVWVTAINAMSDTPRARGKITEICGEDANEVAEKGDVGHEDLCHKKKRPRVVHRCHSKHAKDAVVGG